MVAMSNLSPEKSLSPKKFLVMTVTALALGGTLAAPAHAVTPEASAAPVTSLSHVSHDFQTGARTRIIWLF